MSLSEEARARLRARFVEGLAGRLERLQSVRAELDAASPDAMAKARTLGHQLSGTGGSFGFPELSEHGRALELAPEVELVPALEALLHAVRLVVDQAELEAKEADR